MKSIKQPKKQNAMGPRQKKKLWNRAHLPTRAAPSSDSAKDRFGFDLERDSGAENLQHTEEKSDETKICGRNACMARATRDSSSIVRAYLCSSRQAEFSKLLRELAATKRAYHIVEERVIEKVAGTVHHEGVCFIVHSKPALDLSAFLQQVATQRIGPIVVLDGVSNPHNLGAITRVAAHFGAASVFAIQDCEQNVQLNSASFFRIAQGGAECVTLGCGSVEDAQLLFSALRDLEYDVVGTTCAQVGRQIFTQQLLEKSAFVFGSETHGISNLVAKQISKWITLPGTGNVESLNVACAASAVLAEHWRQNQKNLK